METTDMPNWDAITDKGEAFMLGSIYAHKLIKKGYRRISNQHKLLARIDRPDWRDIISPAVEGQPYEAEHYCRVHSNDRIRVPWQVYRCMPRSHEITEYNQEYIDAVD